MSGTEAVAMKILAKPLV